MNTFRKEKTFIFQMEMFLSPYNMIYFRIMNENKFFLSFRDYYENFSHHEAKNVSKKYLFWESSRLVRVLLLVFTFSLICILSSIYPWK